jgi:hypothetical protein
LSTQPIPQSRESANGVTRDTIIFVMFLLVVALFLSIFELVNVDRELANTPSGWGNIWLAGIPWLFSLMLMVASLIILLGIVARLGRSR